MFDDYVLHLVESLHWQERANELLAAISGISTSAVVKYDDTDIQPAAAAAALQSPWPTQLPSTAAVTTNVPMTVSQGVQERQTVITDAREAYSQSCAISSQILPLRQTRSSPSHSSMTSYDGRNDLDVNQVSPGVYVTTRQVSPVQYVATREVSPAYVESQISLGQHTINQTMSNGDPYDRYRSSSYNSSSISPQNSDFNASSPYTYMNYVQYGYRSRDYNSVRPTDYTEYHRRVQPVQPKQTKCQSNLYTTIDYFRPADYDVSMYGYGNGNTAVTNVTGAIVRKDVTSGVGYGQCAVEASVGLGVGAYGAGTVDDVVDCPVDVRDRRKVSNMESSEQNFSTKRRFAEEFIYESNSSGYRHHHHLHSVNFMNQT